MIEEIKNPIPTSDVPVITTEEKPTRINSDEYDLVIKTENSD